MAGSRVYNCETETDDRSRALEHLQLFTSVLVSQRRQFVMETETKADGSFSLVITGSGKPLGEKATYAEIDPAYEPFIIREAQEWGPEVDSVDEPIAKPSGKKSKSANASESVAQPE